VTATADVVVVGGGVVGCSAAYHLAAAGAGRVLLLERAGAVGTGSTGACAGGFRFQFSSKINVELSIASVPMIVGFSEEHGLPLDVVRDGYLFLIRDDATLRRFTVAAEMQRSLGVDTQVLQPDEAAQLAPGIAVEGLVGATFCPQDGIADPGGLTQGYATVARRAGAEILLETEVAEILTRAGRRPMSLA
jgi:sarcosine oxidase subunit beta